MKAFAYLTNHLMSTIDINTNVYGKSAYFKNIYNILLLFEILINMNKKQFQKTEDRQTRFYRNLIVGCKKFT